MFPVFRISAGLKPGIDQRHRHGQQHAQQISQIPLPAQIQQIWIELFPQPRHNGLRIHHLQQGAFLHSAVLAHDHGHGAHAA
mgnify:CR=1 FL=1